MSSLGNQLLLGAGCDGFRSNIGEQARLITIPVNAGSTESNIRKQLSIYIEFAKLATKMLQCQRGKRRRRAGMGAIGN